jgi:glutathione synthase/RimK-type ligase-like ATP-grasp enzyme
LADTAYDENLYSYNAHPLTGVKFKGKKIVDIDKIVSLAEKLGNICPSMTFIGWDIALTPEGPVVLEGNSSPGLTIIQRTYNGMQEFIKLVQTSKVLK